MGGSGVVLMIRGRENCMFMRDLVVYINILYHSVMQYQL